MATPRTPKAQKDPPPTLAAAEPHAALPHDRTATLDELLARAGEVSPETRELALLALDDAQRLTYGRTIDTDALLSAAVPFAVGAYTLFDRMTPADREHVVGASPELVDLLVREMADLRDRKARFDAVSSQGEINRSARRAAARTAFRKGIALRDRVSTALRGVTALDDRPALDVAIGTAATAQELAAGMRSLARMLTARLTGSTDAQRRALASLRLTAAQAQGLEDGAAAVVATDAAAQGNSAQTRVTQRDLDLGDGTVVHLVGMIHRAFREATSELPTLVTPPLGDLTRFFERVTPRTPAQPPTPQPVG